MAKPIGIRLNNPGNLLVADPEDGEQRQGLATPPLVQNSASDLRHYSFATPQAGIRALVRTLTSIQLGGTVTINASSLTMPNV